MKSKKSLIFVIANTIVLFLIMFFYLWRLIYYYKLEHPKTNTTNLYQILTLNKNIVKYSSGLYKIDDKYIYKGDISSNYVRYSGLLWQVYEVKNDEIKMISYDNLTVLNKNDLNLWIDELIKDFNNYEDYLNMINDKYATILNKEEYDNSLDSKGFINNNTSFWVMNDNQYLSVNNLGEVIEGDNEFNGVRIVISLKTNINIQKGEGTRENPYIIDNNYNDVLSSKYKGEFVLFNNELYRIINKDNSSVHIALDKVLEEKVEFGSKEFNINDGIGKYLNDVFYNNITNKENLVESNFYIGNYNQSYKDIMNKKVNAKIGLFKMGDLFLSDVNEFVLLNGNKHYTNTIYKYKDYNYYADLYHEKYYTRPVISLKNDIIINNGEGTRESPYIIEG